MNLLHQTLPDTPVNREAMLQALAVYDAPFQGPAAAPRRGAPFFLVATGGVIGCVTGAGLGPIHFVIAQWSPTSGVTRLDAPYHDLTFAPTR